MADDRPAHPPVLLPEVAWSVEVGWHQAWREHLGRFAAGLEGIPWSTSVGDAWFQAPPHRGLLPPPTVEALAQERLPTAHDAMELVLAPTSWLVRARDLVYTPWSPVPAALAVAAQAYGVGPEIHDFDPDVLRYLAWRLPNWYRTRGSGTAAAELCAELLAVFRARSAPSEAGAEASAEASADGFYRGALGDAGNLLPAIGPDGLPQEREVLVCWPDVWWRERGARAPDPPQAGAELAWIAADGLVLLPLPAIRLLPGDVLLRHVSGEATAFQAARLLPTWACPRRFPPSERASSPPSSKPPRRTMSPEDHLKRVFTPSEGRVLSLESLEAISTISSDLWQTIQFFTLDGLPQAGAGLVLKGLSVDGVISDAGPPGAMETTLNRRRVVVKAGAALLAYRGRAVIMEIPEDRLLDLPPEEDEETLIILLSLEPTGDTYAHELLKPVLEVVTREAFNDRLLASADVDLGEAFRAAESVVPRPEAWLVLAASMDRAERWETDLACLWSPADARCRRLVERLDEISEVVWLAEPLGFAWTQATLGKDWLRYQCAAAAALQAAALQLQTRPTCTAERVKLLQALWQRLNATVPEAAEFVATLLGPDSAWGPYRALVGAIHRSAPTVDNRHPGAR